MKKFKCAFLILFISFNVQAENPYVTKAKVFLRPHLNKFLGVQKTNELLGAPPEVLELPAIPEVVKNNKSLDVYNYVDPNKDAIPADKKQGLDVQYIRELYEATKKARAKDSDLGKWMNVLSQGGTREGVYRAVVLDDKYAGLENFQFPVNDNVADFSLVFLDKFLNKKYSKEKVLGINFYRLKREMTEKTLEVIDVLRNDPEKLAAWYGVFSGELAQNYPEAWEGDNVRSNKSKIYHKKWAMKAPEQLIKSEVIIKLHKVLNGLMG